MNEAMRVFYCKFSLLFSFLVINEISFAKSQNVLGEYHSVGDHQSTMIISQANEKIQIYLRGGGSKKDVSSVAGDCEVMAKGRLLNNRVEARLVPFEGEVSSLDTEDIEQMNSLIRVSFKEKFAIVEGSFAHCGVGNVLVGRYSAHESVELVRRNVLHRMK